MIERFFCNQKSQCNLSNSAVLKSRQQGCALALSSDSSEEDLEEYGSDLDQSLALTQISLNQPLPIVTIIIIIFSMHYIY